MNIRYATLKDNLQQIAELIYQTDNYIYPFWFENYPNWKDVLIDLIKTKGSLFYFKNILIAEENCVVIGILISINENTDLSFNYESLKSVNKNFEFTINNYVLPTCSHAEHGKVYVSNVCVNMKNRRHHIATQLLNKLKELFPDCIYELDVLADNAPAINLYLNEGLKIKNKRLGFNGPNLNRPFIYSMSSK